MTESSPYFAQKWIRLRLQVASILLFGGAGVLGIYAFRLQVLDGKKYRQIADEQQIQEVELSPHRGRILDRNGAEFAVSIEAESIYANQRLVGINFRQVASVLAPILRMAESDLEKRLNGRRYFSWIKRRVSPEEARFIRDGGFRGVFVTKEPRRYYPHRSLAGSLLGWAGLDGIGQEGVELQYENWLRGRKTKISGLRDALGRPVFYEGVDDPQDALGHDLILTVDRTIQFHLEKALGHAVSSHRAKSGVAVALDARNGEILAMASVPSVNPNAPEHGLRNAAVTDSFEPGSTMKIFAMAAALEANAVGLGDRWNCGHGKYRIGPVTLHDAEEIGSVTTTEVLAKSSNIGTAKIAMRTGKVRLVDMLNRFGFGRATGVDLPGERSGQIRSAQKMGVIDLVTSAFGQGITVTPLQVAAAYATIANGGTWYQPHVLRRVANGRGEVVLQGQTSGRRVISARLADTLKKMLFAVTQTGGTAERLKLAGYSFAGKTGTAQKVDPATHRYSEDKWASSFVGFAPLEHPRFVLFVMIDEPQGTHYGSMVAGPVFVEATANALRWWGIPDKIIERQPTVASSQIATRFKDPKTMDLSANEVTQDEEQRELAPTPAGVKVPDFTGRTMAEVVGLAQRLGLPLKTEGSGYATAQSPGPGVAARTTVCQVVFSPVK